MIWRALLIVPLALLGAAPAVGQPLPSAPGPGGAMPHMMTPSADYCAHLNREVDRARGASPRDGGAANALADEGARMCDRGQYRGGVGRLRRALLLYRNAR